MGEKELTFLYQILSLSLSFSVLMIVSICTDSKLIVEGYLVLPFLFVSAFILTYLKSYMEMYKQETVKWEKCYIAFSMCLPIVHLSVGCIYICRLCFLY